MITTILELYIISQLSNFQIGFQEFQIPELTLNTAKIPVHDGLHIAPYIEAKSAKIVDLKSGITLYDQNSSQQLPIASLTKLMTATIILEENDLNTPVIISEKAANTEGSRIWLYPGEEIRVKDLLFALLIHSANDAAVALAEHNAGSIEAFSEKMNQKAFNLGMFNTSYSNPVGFDEANNYSTADDLAILAQYVYQKPLIREITSIKEMTVTSTDGRIKHDITNTNDLLFSEFFHVIGLKTGSTDEAGECLITISAPDADKQIITVILNSPNRFQETKTLIDWAFQAYKW